MVDVSRETHERLEIFRREFAKWSRTHNLVARGERDDVADRHIEDSLQLLNHHEPFGHWVDVGTGGGFPGAILAAAFAERADVRVTMIESNAKKAAFLRSVCLSMNAPTTVLNERAERVVSALDAPTVVTARAVASLGALLSLTSTWLADGTVGLFPKGRAADTEVEEAGRDWAFDLDRLPSTTSDDAVILRVRNVRPKSAVIVGS